MTAQHMQTTPLPQPRGNAPTGATDDPLLVSEDPVEAAREHVASSALTASPGGRVGLEMEYHLVDLRQPERRPDWATVQRLAGSIGPLPSGSAVTLEPGGQIELSTPPTDDVVSSVAALRADQGVLRERLREQGFGAAPLGTDLARPVRRVNPHARYLAMEQHFDALGHKGSGEAMMSATAALQVNVDAGPESGWQDRLSLVRSMVPMLVAASASSPYLAGGSSGWHSMRQGCWDGIDHGRSDPIGAGEPTEAWAAYALDAPLMLVRDDDGFAPVSDRVTFADWLRGDGPVERRPGVGDLDYHLTTLFPPVRPRGYLEIRCIDALPDRWWPALTAVTVTLLDDPVAADRAAELCAPVEGEWHRAARHGLADPVIATAVTGCLELAADRCPDGLRPEVEGFVELVASGSSPSREIRRRVEAVGPLATLQEESVA